MKRIEPATWTDPDRALWARIAAHDFEHAGASLTFAGRLARDHGWSSAQARAAIDEYRRFCFLALRAGREVTPSEEVDEVWHQHLAYSRDCWQVWCRDVLRHDLHHGPILGGSVEGKRFAGQYAETLAAYEAWFGPPPPGLWPGTAERFGRPRFHVVDRATHVAVPIPRGMPARLRRLARALGLGALLALVSIRPAEAAALDPLDWTAGPFLTLYVALACASLAAAWILPTRLLKEEARSGGRSRLSAAELGLLAGGKARAADVLVLEDIAAGRVVLYPKALTHDGRDVSRASLVAAKSDEVARLQYGLAEEGLALPVPRRWRLGLATLGLVAPVLALGVAKVDVGEARDRPVGILVALLLATAFAAVVLSASRPPASRAGREVLAAYRREHDRALRAPRPEEVVAAFAVAGRMALMGTALEAYGKLMAAAGGDGGGGAGCGGGGGGGGGCGGCGS